MKTSVLLRLFPEVTHTTSCSGIAFPTHKLAAYKSLKEGFLTLFFLLSEFFVTGYFSPFSVLVVKSNHLWSALSSELKKEVTKELAHTKKLKKTKDGRNIIPELDILMEYVELALIIIDFDQDEPQPSSTEATKKKVKIQDPTKTEDLKETIKQFNNSLEYQARAAPPHLNRPSSPAFFAPTTRHLVEIRRNQPDRLKDAIDRDRSIESSQHRSGNILAPPLEAQSLGAIRGWNDFIVASQAKAANQPGPDNYASVPTWYCGKLLTSLKGGDLPHLYVQLLLFTHPELVEYIILHILRSHPSQLFQIHESSVQLDEGDSSPSPVVLSGSPFPSNIQV
ncbi:hypothetical protein PGTUg99_015862 [Puccinia graminis f. sp. tritici]|uniref:Uncharacterized protein n=1 Tax=Puccinia graminis f. sp. tritici TaxID=56615 RepID=A0A5B0MPA8_PUCGR|nr:hypothetical protein PGTUg99_015862 [Puccinia graminis f. sp. tritici]